MAIDPDEIAWREREQCRLIWAEIARVKQRQKKRQQEHAREGYPHKPRATSQTPRVTYAAHISRHEAVTRKTA